ncbi:hypothetical protein [Methylocystis hirsuta]|uniref:hypothetical protein n=1 Tax=Methylocystis hirsuta TaxID=369798 RepID=UPI001FE20254|nr:hypothetical protein [Methylocystis hirsuta]
MSAHWTPTVESYFGKVTKARILAAVREAKGEATAQMINHLKKSDMAIEAERLLQGTGWLPEPCAARQRRGPTRQSSKRKIARTCRIFSAMTTIRRRTTPTKMRRTPRPQNDAEGGTACAVPPSFATAASMLTFGASA